MVFNPSAGADEALGPFSFFRIINILSMDDGCFTPSFIKINLLIRIINILSMDAEISRTPDSESRDEKTCARTHNSAKR